MLKEFLPLTNVNGMALADNYIIIRLCVFETYEVNMENTKTTERKKKHL